MRTSAAVIDDPRFAPFRGAQEDFLRDWTNPFIALEGGWMAGKTWAGAMKLVRLHMYNATDSLGNLTFVQSCVVGPTYKNMTDFDLPAIERAADVMNLQHVYRRGDHAMVFPELGTAAKPSRILFRPASMPEQITGFEVGAAWGDEPARWPESWDDPKRDAYIQLTGRVRAPGARFSQVLMTYTNEGDVTRVYGEFHSGKPGHAVYRARTTDNTLPEAQRFAAQTRERLTPEMSRQYLDGEAVSLRGVKAYSCFDPANNVSGNVELVEALPMQLALDFNISPGMHALVGQYNAAQEIFTTAHEIFEPRLDIGGVVDRLARIVGKLGGWKWPKLEIFGDPSGHAHSFKDGESSYAYLLSHLKNTFPGVKIDMNVPRAHDAVSSRIMAVNVALRDVRGRSHWLINPRCQRLLNDLEKVKTDNEGKLDKRNPDLSHASDASGYLINYLRPVRIESEPNAGQSRFSVRT